MIPVLKRAIRSLLNLDSSTWNTYVPRPFDFIADPDHRLYSCIADGADEQGLWEPNWFWGQYKEAWKVSKENWKALRAIRYYSILQSFGRI